ncbi:Methyltransferase domain-containing protein [Cohnella sp. OV330]|nr:Methyltransferase domain-containing protein [Cohnella sp. OV330]
MDWEISSPKFESDELNDKLRVAPWEGHRNFAYDLFRYIVPQVSVELGTHYGCSLFAFAQSMKNHELDVSLFAVDTWRGDDQAGFYGEEVIGSVTDIINKRFSKLNITLLRKTFDEALSDFADESIDLLHIDGLHTYEAVSHDFETWLPKVSSNGIVLFHDVYSPLEYGSNRFWQEIKEQYPHFEFRHSWGLGVLFPKGNDRYKLLENVNFKDKALIYEYKALYKFEQLKNHDLNQMVVERDKAISSIEALVIERDKTIFSNEEMIIERDNVISNNEGMISDLKLAFKNSEQLVTERDKLIKEYETKLLDLQNTIAKNSILINEQDLSIKVCNEQIDKLKQEISKKQEIIDYVNSKRIIFNFKKKI